MSIIDKKDRGDAVHVVGASLTGEGTFYIAVEQFETERRMLVESRSYLVDGGGSNNKAGVTASGRLLVDATMSGGTAVRPYYWWDYAVDGSTVVGTDTEFDFGSIQRDIYLSSNQPISIKWNSTGNKIIGLPKGRFTFRNQFANKVFITTTATTKLQIYGNG